MGDLETHFMERVAGHLDLPSIDLLFAPHHGRGSRRGPDVWLEQLDPTVIVLGEAEVEAEAEHVYYYLGRNTITQNRAGDIAFDRRDGRVDVYVSSDTYTADFLYHADASATLGRYIGSFRV